MVFSFFPPIGVGPPPRDPASLLAHRALFSSDTICNDLGPPLADIVLFRLPLKALKHVC